MQELPAFLPPVDGKYIRPAFTWFQALAQRTVMVLDKIWSMTQV